MDIAILLGTKILSMLIACLVGFIIVRAKLLTTKSSENFTKLLLFVCSPCALVSAYQIEYTDVKAIGLLIAFILAIIIHIVYIVVVKFLGKALKLSDLERAAVIYSNAGFLIIPIVTSVLGPEWVFYTCAYCATQSVLYWTHGVSLLSGKKTFNVKKIVLNPNIIAILLGLTMFFTQIHFPAIIQSSLNDFGLLLGPVSMLIIGMLIADKPLLKIFSSPRAYFVCLLRLLFIPAVTIILFFPFAKFIVHDDLKTIMLIVLLSASSSVGSMVPQLAQIYGGDYEYGSQLNLLSVLLCLLTMPLVCFVFTMVI